MTHTDVWAPRRSKKHSMPLLKHGRIADDPWLLVADDTDLPEGPAIVSLERWQAEREQLQARNAPLGVRLGSDQPPTLIANDLNRFGVIALDFPIFKDGRAFSYARMLRERYKYEGEVRAVGEVLRDQFLYMHRCGFDAFDVASDNAEEEWRAALSEVDVFYQPGMAGGPSAIKLRSDPDPRDANTRPTTK